MHFSIYTCSVFVSKLREMDSKNSRALSLDILRSLSWPSKSKSLAPDSVISLASYRAAFKLCNLEDMLKSIIELLPPISSSSISTSDDCIALYIIYAIFSNSLTAYPEASYNFFGFRTIRALLAKSWHTWRMKLTRSFSSSMSSLMSILGSYRYANQ